MRLSLGKKLEKAWDFSIELSDVKAHKTAK